MADAAPGAGATGRTVVLDTGAVLAGLGPAQSGASGGSVTRFVAPERVRDEVRPGGPTGRSLERQLDAGLVLVMPTSAARERVREAARVSGDLPVLSPTDLDVLAAALDAPEGAEVWSDDLAVQNVARRLGVAARPATGRAIRAEVVWHVRCTGCGRYPEAATPAGECPVCGSPLKRTRRPPDGRRV